MNSSLTLVTLLAYEQLTSLREVSDKVTICSQLINRIPEQVLS